MPYNRSLSTKHKTTVLSLRHLEVRYHYRFGVFFASRTLESFVAAYPPCGLFFKNAQQNQIKPVYSILFFLKVLMICKFLRYN